MELVVVRNKWISLFIHGTFQCYIFMLSTRFFWSSRNDFNCLIKHGGTFSSLNISRRTYCSSCSAEYVNFIVYSWYFSVLYFHAFYSILLKFKKWFQLSHKTWRHFLFAQHLEAYLLLELLWTCLRCDIFSPKAGNWIINLWNR